MSCGIYKIQNLINNKIYIGQSTNIEERLRRHKIIHDDCVIHKAIQKYGAENFSYEIIELCEIPQLDQKEIYWINYYQSTMPIGYNMVDGGSNGAGFAKGRAVLQYDLLGNFIAEYPSARQAAEKTQINNSSISACCRGEISHTKDFQWKYKDSDKLIFPIKNVKIIKRSILQYDLNGQFVKKYSSLAEAFSETNICKSTISNVCNRKGKTAGGYLWCFEDDIERINEFNNLKEKTLK